MSQCLFVSDLHGSQDRYRKLFEVVRSEQPMAVFLGGDLLPHWGLAGDYEDFFEDVIAAGLRSLRKALGDAYPSIYVILGNDDPRCKEDRVRQIEQEQLWLYAHHKSHALGRHSVHGYAFVPPTPFLNKDWEKYDVSRYIPPGAVSPEEGFRSVPVDPREVRFATIAKDLDELGADVDMSSAILLIHTPPYDTHLDRVGKDGHKIDHVPLDLHVGSIAVRRFIESRQPLVTLHGHIHESARITGHWRDRLGETHMFSAAHDGPELCLVRFDPADLDSAERVLL